MTSFSHPTHLLCVLCLFDLLFPFPIRDQTKSNCRDKSTFASSWERVCATLFYCGRFKRVTARVARVTGALNTIPEECTVLCSGVLYHGMRGWWGGERLFITPSHSLRLSRRCCPYVLVSSHLSVLVPYALKHTLFHLFVCKSSLTFLSTPNKKIK